MGPKRQVGQKSAAEASPPSGGGKSKKAKNEEAEPCKADIFYVQYCRYPNEADSSILPEVEQRQVVRLTPGQSQIMALRKSVDPHVLLFVAQGYKYKLFGRDSRVAARRLGICCIVKADEPWEYSSIPLGRVGYHSARLVAMGYTVCVADQESAALKQEVGKKGIFERSMKPYMSRGTLMEAPKLNAAGAGGDEDDDDEDGGGGGGGNAMTTAGGHVEDSLPDFSAMGDRFLLFVAEEEKLQENPDHGPKKLLLHQSLSLLSFATGQVFSVSVPEHVDAGQLRATLRDVIMVAHPVEVICAQRGLTDPTRKVIKTLLQLNSGPSREGLEDAFSVVYAEVSEAEADDDATTATTGTGSGKNLKNHRSYALSLQHLAKFGLGPAAAALPVHHMSQLTSAVVQEGSGEEGRTDHPGQGGTISMPTQTMYVSGSTLRHLDVLCTATPSGQQQDKGSLLWLLHHCATPMGYRLLRKWLLNPLADQAAIEARLDIVEWLSDPSKWVSVAGRSSVGAKGGGVRDQSPLACLLSAKGGDMETTVTRLSGGKCSPSEYLAMLSGLTMLIKQHSGQESSNATGVKLLLSQPSLLPAPLVPILHSVISSDLLGAVEAVETQLLTTSVDESSGKVTYQPWHLFINANYSAMAPCVKKAAECESSAPLKKLNELFFARHTIFGKLATYLQEVREKTGLGSQVDYKTVLTATYLLEMPVKDEKKALKGWTVSSRTKAMTRFTSPEQLELVQALAANEARIKQAGEEAWLEHQRVLWGPVAGNLGESLPGFAAGCAEIAKLTKTALGALAQLDVLLSFAAMAAEPKYCKPKFNSSKDDSRALHLEGLRHPMLLAENDGYIPNTMGRGRTEQNTANSGGSVWIVTGPNMGGKSALMRSVAICVLMAHIGCYVPCEGGASMPIFSSIRSRMGAEDSILQGNSTFLTEMLEAATILRAPDLSTSLVLMDEIGRGTSSFDGMAVASAVLSHLISSGATAMFITHFPQLCQPYLQDADGGGRVNCKYMSFRTEDGDRSESSEEDSVPKRITFLYTAVDGVTPSSFGLNIAQAAAVPRTCVALAQKLSSELERDTLERQARQKVLSFLSPTN